VTIFKAARRCRRQFIIDMYTAEILRVAGNSKLPQADWDGISVFLPEFQKRRLVRTGKASIANKYRPYRIFPEELAVTAMNSVMLFRPSMQIDVDSARCLDGTCLVYSMWDGYLTDKKTKPFLEWFKGRGIRMYKCHTSGHASVRDLQRLRKAFAGAVVCPIHTREPMAFKQLFGNVKVLTDGEHFDINQS